MTPNLCGILPHCLYPSLTLSLCLFIFSNFLVLSSSLSIYPFLSPSVALSKHLTTHFEILWRCKFFIKWSMTLKVTWGHFLKISGLLTTLTYVLINNLCPCLSWFSFTLKNQSLLFVDPKSTFYKVWISNICIISYKFKVPRSKKF